MQTQMKKNLLKMKTLKPFLAVAVFFLLAGVAFHAATYSSESTLRFILFWSLCMMNLFFLAKAVASVLNMMTDNDPTQRPMGLISTFFWGSLKLIGLGLLGFLIFQYRDASMAPVLSGVATLVIVPLVGGMLWSQLEMRPEES